MNDFTDEQQAAWFAGLPAWLAFAVGRDRVSLTADRTPDADGQVAVQFPDGVRRVPLAEVRYWPLWQEYPGEAPGKRRGNT